MSRTLVGVLSLTLFGLLTPLAHSVVGAAVAAAPTTCSDDGFEDNDSFGDPAPVTEGLTENLRSCALDDDYFSIQLSVGDEITIDVSFSHAEGDIDLALFNPSATLVASSESATDDEQIVYTAPEAGIFVIRVHLYEDLGVSEGNDYALDIAIAPAPPVPVPTASPVGVIFLALLLGVILHRHRHARSPRPCASSIAAPRAVATPGPAPATTRCPSPSATSS